LKPNNKLLAELLHNRFIGTSPHPPGPHLFR
jgi:hypothetical protein